MGSIAAGTEQAVVREITEANGVGDTQVRLAWTLHKGPNVLAVPGTGDPAHLEDDIAAAGLRLSDDELSRLDTIG